MDNLLASLKQTEEWKSLVEDFTEEQIATSIVVLESGNNDLPAVWIGISDATLIKYPGDRWVPAYVPLDAEAEHHFKNKPEYIPVQKGSFQGRATNLYMRVPEGWSGDYAIAFDKLMRVPLSERSDPKHEALMRYVVENGDEEMKNILAANLNIMDGSTTIH